MRRNRFLPFLILSLGAHLAVLLLWRGDQGGRDASVPYTLFLRSPGDPAASTPARLNPGALPAPSNNTSPRKRAARPSLARPLPKKAASSQSPSADPSSVIQATSEGPASMTSPGGAGEGGIVEIPSGGGTSPAEGGGSASPPSGLSPAVSSPPLVRAEPDYARNPPPAYPRSARERGWEGTVRLQVRVSAAGEVAELEVESSSGHPVLDRAALEAVRGWRFRPARLGERPVEGVVLVPVAFTLRRS